jgi:hypothetical protein
VRTGPARITLPRDRLYIGTAVLEDGALTVDGVRRRTWRIDDEPRIEDRRGCWTWPIARVQEVEWLPEQ